MLSSLTFPMLQDVHHNAALRPSQGILPKPGRIVYHIGNDHFESLTAKVCQQCIAELVERAAWAVFAFCDKESADNQL